MTKKNTKDKSFESSTKLKKATKKKESKKEQEQPFEEEGMQNKYMQLQMLDQQIRQIQQYIQTFDQQLVEINNVIDSLKEFSKLKKGDLIQAPIASGIFVKARIEDSSEVKVNVGSNVVVTKTIEQAVKMLEGQEAEITQYRSDSMARFNELIKKAEALQSE